MLSSISEQTALEFCELYAIVFGIFMIIQVIVFFAKDHLVLSHKPSDKKLISGLNKTYEKNKKRCKPMCDYIKKTLKLGGKITATSIDDFQYIIYHNGKYFGVYDVYRHTFVD